MTESVTKKERIVVVGGGFAGINLIKKIDKSKYEVILVDKNNFHSFPPLFYQIASSGLDSGSISFPFRREIRKVKGAKFRLGEVKNVNLQAKTIETQFDTIPYDKLVIAAGTTNNYFGIPNLKECVFTLKSMAEALRLKSEILERLERASLVKDSESRRKLLSFVVVGAGPTGVEVAGALGEMKRYILSREYPEISLDEVSITLLEGADRVLRTMSETASMHAYEDLKHLMVDVKLGVNMQKYEDNVVYLSDGSQIYCESLIWTAGITAESFEGFDKSCLGPGNRFIVDEYNRVKGCEDVFALGDIAYLTSKDFERGYPQLAQVAIQQAVNLSKNLNIGKLKYAFRYNDMGSMATVGRNRAVADLRHIHLSGRIAWLTWMFIHLISLLGMRNKINVLINWIWAYFTYSTSLRLLLRPAKYPQRAHWDENSL